MNNKSFGLLIGVMLLMTHVVVGQADQEAVIPRKSTNIEIVQESGKLLVREHYSIEKVFYKNFDRHSYESVFFSDFEPIVDFDARILIPEKSKYKTVKVSNVETKDIVQSGIFYGGYKRRSFVYPGITSGSIGKLEYSVELSDMHLISPFYFNDEEVEVKESELVVTTPSSVLIDYRIYGIAENEVTFTKQIQGNNLKYSWKLNNILPFHKDDDSPSRSYSAPHVVVFIKSFDTKGKRKNVLSDPADLYSWCAEMVRMMPPENKQVLVDAVADIVKNSVSDEEKVMAIFQWVQSNISYVAFEDGMAGFIPRAASDVYVKRYGDCKDMANLLKSMINITGLEASLAWIGTRSKPYSFHDTPAPIVSNHMICSVKLKGNFVFLDATDSYGEFGKPTSMIQGKEALIGVSDTKFEIVKVPVVDRSQNVRNDSIQISVTDKDIKGSMTTMLKGYKKEELEYKKLKHDIEKDNDFLEDFLKIGNNNISLGATKIDGLGKQNDPAIVSVDFSLPGYYKKVGDKMYVNLNLSKALPGSKVDVTTRKQLIEMDYKYEDRSVVILTIPDQYNVSFIPTNTSKEWGNFAVSTVYQQKGNQVILEKKFYSNALYLDSTKFGEWNEMLNAMTEINQQSITLTKTK